MKTIFQLFITFYLVVFTIGSGRICGCEVLGFIGVDHCQHSSDHCDHHDEPCSDHEESDKPTDHEHAPNDCCELMTPIEADLPRAVEVPVFEGLGSDGNLGLASVNEIYQLNLSFEKWYFPPPDSWVDTTCSLPALQRFLV